jgi:hypothetical protein
MGRTEAQSAAGKSSVHPPGAASSQFGGRVTGRGSLDRSSRKETSTNSGPLEVQLRPPLPHDPGSLPDNPVTDYSEDIGNTLAAKGLGAHSTRPTS